MRFPEHSEEMVARGLLITALLSGCGLMAPLIDGGPLALDEHVSYWIVGADNPGTLIGRSLNYSATPPFSFWLQRISLSVGGDTALVLRSSSAIGYLIAIAFTYLFACEMLGPIGGGLAALVFAWHPGVVDEVRIARMYGPTVMLAAMAFWITVKWKCKPNSLHWAILWACTNVCLIWNHYTNVAVVGAEVLVILFVHPIIYRESRRSLWLTILALLLILMSVVPLLPAVEYLWEFSNLLNFSRTAPPIWKMISPLWWIGLPAGLLTGIILSRGRFGMKYCRNFQTNYRLILLCVAVSFFLVLLGTQGTLTSLSNARYRIGFTIPVACFLAGSLSCWPTWRVSFAAVCVTIVTSWSVAENPPWKFGHLGARTAVEWKTIAETIERDGRPGEPVFVQGGLVESLGVPAMYMDKTFMDYIACRLGRFYLKTPHPRYGLPAYWSGIGNDLEVTQFYSKILDDSCTFDSPLVWVACATDTDLNRESLAGIQNVLQERGFTVVENYHFDSAALLRYRCTPRKNSERDRSP